MRDGERTIRFGEGTAAEASGLLSEHGFGEYTLLTTPRAAGSAPLEPARTVEVPLGLVDEISAALLADAGDRPLVALGGGRVIDTAKAIAGWSPERRSRRSRPRCPAPSSPLPPDARR